MVSIEQLLEEQYRLLKKFKIQTKCFVVKDLNNNPIKVVITGGTEVIREAKTKADINSSFLDIGRMDDSTICEESGILPYRYTDTYFDVTKLKELLELKEIKSLSKEKAMSISKDIKSKSELEDEIVYILDREPKTNSLALAKQFDLKHFQVVEKIFELGVMYPSTLMKIKYDAYSDEVDASSGRPSYGGLNRIEYSMRTKYDTFVHIPEDVYYLFLKKLGTPKGIDTDKGKAKLIFREDKQDEYFKAFQKTRDFLYSSDIKRDELQAIMKKRTKGTIDLMASIYDYSKHYDINIVNANRFVFNIVNYLSDINAINYIPLTDKEVEAGETRQTKEEHIQAELLRLEDKISASLIMAKRFDVDFTETICTAIKKTEKEVRSILKEYGVEFLYDNLKR